jgi:hypothetical protein
VRRGDRCRRDQGLASGFELRREVNLAHRDLSLIRAWVVDQLAIELPGGVDGRLPGRCRGGEHLRMRNDRELSGLFDRIRYIER